MPNLRIRHAFVAVLLLVSMLVQGTWALAGTTGSVTGYVRDSDGVPVANAKVTATSPSEVTSTTTDGSGHFSFLSLAPDTYTVSASKEGYQESALPGVTVFADNVQNVSVTMPKALKTIASVRTQAASSLVKSGVGGDIYNVTPAQMQKTAALGGGGNMDSAYSAIASVPGLVVGTGGAGWNQAVVVRGANPWSTGFEYDGIPVNRAFDNYTASTASNLGLQELQVYTGGGPASISSTGTSGFINQVIKTGTYPGYGMLSGGLAADGAYYHSARAEAGGASPNRNFSYYAGITGYDQSFHIVDNNMGASYFGAGSQYAPYGYTTELTAIGAGVFNACGPQGLADPSTPAQGCIPQMPGSWGYNNLLQDRENVVNLHFGMPRHDGQRDDLQLMWSASAMQTFNATSPNLDGQLNNWMVSMTGTGYCPPLQPASAAADCFNSKGAYVPNYPYYQDAYQYNLAFGTNVAPNGVTSPLKPGIYYQSNTPAHSFQSELPLNGLNDMYNNDTGILKAQLTHPLDSRSFLRLMGYTFFSDWTEDGAISGFAAGSGWEYDSPNYDLITHTAGGMLQYFNQLNDKHLLQFTANYTHANVNRFNHSGGGSTSVGSTPLGLISIGSNGQYTCYDARATVANPSYDPTQPVSSTNEPTIPNTNDGNPVPCYSSSYKSSAGHVAAAGTLPAITGNALANGAYWATLQNGNASGTFNSVVPNFTSASLEDQWRPSDKVTINASVRFDQFSYNLAPGAVNQNPFYAQMVENYACVNPVTHDVLVSPLLPGQYPPASPVLTNKPCNDPSVANGTGVGYVHPNGQAQPGYSGPVPTFTLNVPNTYKLSYWEPRISGTYTENPDTVWRFSAGRFAEPPLSAAVEYLYRGGSGTSLWTNFMALGTYSPFHPITGETSAQYDFSLEKRLHGTAMSFKLTPYYGTTSNWEQQSFIGAGFVTQIPVGRARNYGVEAQFNYGDFNREGFSGLVSFTYSKSQVQFQSLLGANQIDDMNTAIKNFNALTKSGGGAPCYENGAANTTCSDPLNPGAVIANPYYNMASQGTYDPSGWYEQALYALKPGVNTGTIGFYNSPYVANLVVNYRHQRFAITPSLQFQAGAAYGSPYDVVGVDPRNCTSNQGPQVLSGTPATNIGGTGVATTNNPQTCDYTTAGPGAAPAWTYLYVPNPQTGKFTSYGQYRQPNIMVANLQASYDVSPKVTLQLTAADLWHTCFGGSSTPWTAANGPSTVNCGYYSNGLYNGAGWYNGVSAFDKAANNGVASYAWENQPYLPKFNNSIGAFIPFTLYVQAQVKL
jgi:hypothetical protein